MKSNMAVNTEQVTGEGYDLKEAIESKDKERVSAIRLRESRRREDRRWKKLYKDNGSLKNYSQPGIAFVGLIAAGIVLIFVFWTWEWSFTSHKWEEFVADAFIIAGTFFAAAGVVLSHSTAKWLGEIVEQEENILHKTKLVREATLTRDLMALVRCIQHMPVTGVEPVSDGLDAGDGVPSLERFMSHLRDRLKKEVSGRDHVYVISQKDLAKAFLAASKYSLFGTMMILVGTAGLAMLAIHK